MVSITKGAFTITPTREKGLAYLHLRDLIANSTYWKAMVAEPEYKIAEIVTLATADTSSRPNAIEQISIERADDERDLEDGAISLPSCIIRFASGVEIARRYGPGAFDISGAFFIEFMIRIPADYRPYPDLGAIDAAEKFDAIEAEMLYPVTQSDGLVIDSIQQLPMGELTRDGVNGQRVRKTEYMVTFESSQ